MTIYSDNGGAFNAFPERIEPNKGQSLRLEVSAYLQTNHGLSHDAAEAAVLRMGDAELERYYTNLRANDGLMRHIGTAPPKPEQQK